MIPAYLYRVLKMIFRRVNGLRIKTDATASGSLVENVIYENNKISGITEFGVLIDQSYPSTLGTPGTGVIIEVSARRTFSRPYACQVCVSHILKTERQF